MGLTVSERCITCNSWHYRSNKSCEIRHPRENALKFGEIVTETHNAIGQCSSSSSFCKAVRTRRVFDPRNDILFILVGSFSMVRSLRRMGCQEKFCPLWSHSQQSALLSLARKDFYASTNSIVMIYIQIYPTLSTLPIAQLMKCLLTLHEQNQTWTIGCVLRWNLWSWSIYVVSLMRILLH